MAQQHPRLSTLELDDVCLHASLDNELSADALGAFQHIAQLTSLTLNDPCTGVKLSDWKQLQQCRRLQRSSLDAPALRMDPPCRPSFQPLSSPASMATR
jgi:hypothetical protein